MAKQTFEDALKRLEAIVQELETGELDLEKSLEKFQEGIKLSSFCAKKLDDTEKKVTLLLKSEDGTVKETAFPLDLDDMDRDGEDGS